MIIHADLHIHTCLSPCSDLEMSPLAIVETALTKGLGLIAISDHNSAQNARAVIDAGRKRGLAVLPAMEVSSLEEAHVLCVFPDIETALEFQSGVYRNIEQAPDSPITRDQVLASEFDEVDGFCPYLLFSSSQMPVRSIVEQIHALDGIAIAAHIDRPSFSVISQLGFIPPHIRFDALEISANLELRDAADRFPEYAMCPFITNSDAHYLHDIGRAFTCFDIPAPTFLCIRDALYNRNGCRIVTAA